MDAGVQPPCKTRDLHNHHMDSTIWDEFEYRNGDVVIGTWAKSGTTWVQQIVGQLLLGPDPDIHSTDLAPWLDMRVMPRKEILAMLDAQQHRRFIKTHLPVDAIVFSDKAKYLYIGRDGRDVLWSLHHHHCNFTDEAYQAFNETPGLVGPRLERPHADIRRYWREWLDGDGYPFWSFSENIRSWWDIRDLPNVKLLHFNDLKADMERGIREIADFLEVDLPGSDWPKIFEYCSFDWMKANANRTMPLAERIFTGGGRSFVNKGTNGRWRDLLSVEDCAEFDAVMQARLGEDCARWLAHENAPA